LSRLYQEHSVTERPNLTYEVFITLAQQQGFEMDTVHLKELFPEVQAMFRRMKLLDQVDTSGIQPSCGFIPGDSIAQE
jgi:hypothetical protein|tara:strand:- start:264 stop:497 length:234 start_codon:yes stop_codon:yes gene_type:complete